MTHTECQWTRTTALPGKEERVYNTASVAKNIKKKLKSKRELLRKFVYWKERVSENCKRLLKITTKGLSSYIFLLLVLEMAVNTTQILSSDRTSASPRLLVLHSVPKSRPLKLNRKPCIIVTAPDYSNWWYTKTGLVHMENHSIIMP